MNRTKVIFYLFWLAMIISTSLIGSGIGIKGRSQTMEGFRSESFNEAGNRLVWRGGILLVISIGGMVYFGMRAYSTLEEDE